MNWYAFFTVLSGALFGVAVITLGMLMAKWANTPLRFVMALALGILAIAIAAGLTL